MNEGSRRAVLVAFVANLGVATAKLVGWTFTGAASLLAEGVHSIADSGNQLLLFVGHQRAQRPPTAEHPFGHARERYFWAFLVAVLLFTVGALFAISEGIDKLRHPHEIGSPGWALGILVAAVAMEGYALRTAVAEARRSKQSQSWWSFIRHAKEAALPVILLEDMGALIGLVVALVSIGLSALTGNPAFDAIGSIIIGALLAVIAFIMGSEMQSLLIGESASPRAQAIIRRAIETHARIERLIHLRTQHLGPNELLVAAKVEFDDSLALSEAAAVIDEVEREIREREPSARLIYIEHDVYRPE